MEHEPKNMLRVNILRARVSRWVRVSIWVRVSTWLGKSFNLFIEDLI